MFGKIRKLIKKAFLLHKIGNPKVLNVKCRSERGLYRREK